jgi:hypothetical protein
VAPAPGAAPPAFTSPPAAADGWRRCADPFSDTLVSGGPLFAAAVTAMGQVLHRFREPQQNIVLKNAPKIKLNLNKK